MPDESYYHPQNFEPAVESCSHINQTLSQFPSTEFSLCLENYEVTVHLDLTDYGEIPYAIPG